MSALHASRAAAVVALSLGVAAGGSCTPRAVSPAPRVAPGNPLPARTPLPAIPLVTGPLGITLTSPRAGQFLDLDSTFIFGVTGSGDAALTINGASVPVARNGAFLAYMAVPRGDAPAFELV